MTVRLIPDASITEFMEGQILSIVANTSITFAVKTWFRMAPTTFTAWKLGVGSVGPAGATGATGATGAAIDNFIINADSGTTPYLPALGDANTDIIMLTNTNGTITLPSESTTAFAVGASLTFVWKVATGTNLAFVAGAGATIRNPIGLKFRAPNSVATAIKIATNEWLIAGDLKL
jgi:hypothetical protein